MAKLQIKIEPAQLGPATCGRRHRDGDQNQALCLADLVLESPAMGFRIQHDRNWFVTSKQRENITLRRVNGSDSVAQCTLTMLPPKSAGRQTTLEQFQKDIVYSLGQRFGELVSTRQWQNAHGHYCYEVVRAGQRRSRCQWNGITTWLLVRVVIGFRQR